MLGRDRRGRLKALAPNGTDAKERESMNIRNAPAGTIRAALRHRGFRWLLAGMAVSQHPRYVLAAALVALGLPMPLLAVIGWPALAIAVVAFCGVGSMLIEVTMETCLQRTLDEEVFGRAYGLALPASLAGILAGSLIGPALSEAVGTSGALVIIGCAVIGYAAVVLQKARVPGVALRPVPVTVASK
jgi:hypothetical protein